MSELGFYLLSVGLGISLAIDAFSVSLANGLNEPNMKKRKMCAVAGIFSLFQFLMPLLGWVCVHTLVEYFKVFEKFIPWISLVLLCFIGGKMLIEGIKGECECEKCAEMSFDCVMCGVCSARCPAGISHPQVAMLARRLNGKYLAPKSAHVSDRVQEIKDGTFTDLIEALMQKPIEEIKELYNNRDIEK